MSDPFPAVAEVSAAGETADLFVDIRATVGVRVVNLVWRHLATLDGALPWAWAAVKPLYLRGMVDTAAARFRSGMTLPRLGSLAGEEPASVDAVLASYDHSNTINLLALGALLAWLRGETGAAGTAEQGPRLPAPDVALPPLASEADVPPETWALVLRLNRFGDRPRPLILASMYRHLAHAPAFLRRIEDVLAPVQADGSLGRAIAANRASAHVATMRLARAVSARPPPLADQIETSVAAFVDHAIGKMATIGRAIRVARRTLP
ncbi:MAG: hypothetical protein A3D94_06735 [Alphaproteobacteria bacterium RIFCSPHIGHO2_12_FULL_66_14]|nr:MAG: hypothetical protein A3D94_06735 [Alphaproteobacteria bacterium RIFCSPHIGHO2_12_FULL_66_14]